MKKKQVYVLVGVLILLVAGYIGGYVYFFDHFYPGSRINGFEVEYMDLQEAKDVLTRFLKEQKLTVQECEMTETLKDLPLSMDLDQADSFVGQSVHLWPFQLSKDHVYEIPIELDKKEMKKLTKTLNCFKEPRKEHAAYLTYNGDSYEIIPEIYGTRIENKKKLFRAVNKAAKNLKGEIVLDRFFYQPKKKADNKRLNKSLAYANGLLNLGIYYEFGSIKEELTNDKVADMIRLTKSGKAILDEELVRQYVQSLADTYDTSYTVRDFTTHYGSTVKIYDGDYGWWTNTAESVAKLMEKMENKEGGKAEIVYRETAVNYTHDGVEFGDTYVEISISAQTLYLYKDGSCILSTPIVSGCVNKGRGTPRGMYPITYKETNHRMVGEDYDVDTSFWMPFCGNVGIHDATWRSSFGGSQYLNNGSHGCVNIPYWAAKTIFSTVSKGTAVIVY